jgi:hypothetical protein
LAALGNELGWPGTLELEAITGEWKHGSGNVKLEKRTGMDADSGKREWREARPHIRTRLEQGVKLAPAMVDCAMAAVTQYELFQNGWAGDSMPPEMNEILAGWCKYFEFHEILKKEGNPSRWLSGIRSVYGFVAGGMENGYDLVLYRKRV